jgi:hypothetical protein
VGNAEYIELRVIQKRRPAPVRYYFMNILDVVPCLDRTRSKYTEFSPDSGGGILRIYELYLDEEKVGERKLFVLDEKIHIVVREDLAEKLRMAKFTGFIFRELPKGLF